MKEIIHKLQEQQATIATMESCTGGAVASEITNYDGASEVLKFSAVTYSNEYKIKMGVDEEIIDTYSVYSMETAKSMAKSISEFANADYGIGVTGKFNAKDPANDHGADDEIFVSIYDAKNDEYHDKVIKSTFYEEFNRRRNKANVINHIKEMLEDIL